MTSGKRRLGRGLLTLLGNDAASEDDVKEEGVQHVAVEQLWASTLNPRQEFLTSELDELASSIREHGVIQPILVRPMKNNDGFFRIIAGERRWRAAERAGFKTVPVLVRKVTDQEASELALVENLQRVDLNPMEEAVGYQNLMVSFSYTQEGLAKITGKSRSHIANTLRLLKLPDKAKQHLKSGELTAGHARAVLGAKDPEALTNLIVKNGLSVRAAEELARSDKYISQIDTHTRKKKDTNTLALEKALTAALGLQARINPIDDAKGSIVLKYSSAEQFQNLVTALQRSSP